MKEKSSGKIKKYSVFKSDHPEYQKRFHSKITPQIRKQWEIDVGALLKSGVSDERLHKILRQNVLWEPDHLAGNHFGRYRSNKVLEGKGEPVRRHHIHERAEVAKLLIERKITPHDAFDMMQKVHRITDEEHKMTHNGHPIPFKDMDIL